MRRAEDSSSECTAGRSGTPTATFLAVSMGYHLTPTPKKSSHKIRRQVDTIVGRIHTPAVSHPSAGI